MAEAGGQRMPGALPCCKRFCCFFCCLPGQPELPRRTPLCRASFRSPCAATQAFGAGLRKKLPFKKKLFPFWLPKSCPYAMEGYLFPFGLFFWLTVSTQGMLRRFNWIMSKCYRNGILILLVTLAR